MIKHERAIDDILKRLDGFTSRDACIVLTFVLCKIVVAEGEDQDFLLENVARQFRIMKQHGEVSN